MREANNPKSNIRELQRMLRTLTRTGGADIASVNPDGIYGPETRRAVEDFQRLYGLPVTGGADSDTWNRLTAAVKKVLHDHAEPAPVRILPPGFAEFGLGTEGDAVFAVQIMLNALSAVYSNLSAVPVSGKYDEGLCGAVERFRCAAGLPAGQTVNCEVWNRMAALYGAETDARS